MFIQNIKINGKLIFKITFIILFILILLMCAYGMFQIFGAKEDKISNYEYYSRDKIQDISASNYSNVLKTVHNNIDEYVGMKIRFTGFVYRLYDFSENQFVLGRQMIVSTDMQAVVVGFLCNLNEVSKYEDGTWVEIEGTIQKGDYHGEMPIIEVENIKQVEIPSEEYVYPPDQSYVATSATL